MYYIYFESCDVDSPVLLGNCSVLQAYSPLAKASKLSDAKLVALAKQVNKSPAQVWYCHSGGMMADQCIQSSQLGIYLFQRYMQQYSAPRGGGDRRIYEYWQLTHST